MLIHQGGSLEVLTRLETTRVEQLADTGATRGITRPHLRSVDLSDRQFTACLIRGHDREHLRIVGARVGAIARWRCGAAHHDEKRSQMAQRTAR